MIIAIATDQGYVSPHFGRCEGYTMVDIDGNDVVKRYQLDNPGHEPGVIPKFLHEAGAAKIICGGIGSRATELFSQYGIEILAGIDGTVEDVVEKLREGTLAAGESLCRHGAGYGYGIEKTVCDHAHEH